MYAAPRIGTTARGTVDTICDTNCTQRPGHGAARSSHRDIFVSQSQKVRQLSPCPP